MERVLIVSSVLLWMAVLTNLLLTLALIRQRSTEPASQGQRKNYGGPPVGQSAPDFAAETLEGRRVTRADYAGHSVAFLLVAPNCAPCREALPRYEALAPHAARAGVELVLISIDTATPTRAFAAEQGIRLPILVAPHEDNPLMRDYNFTGTPSYCLLDAQGTVRAAGYPSFEWGEWQALAQEWEAGTAPQVATPA